MTFRKFVSAMGAAAMLASCGGGDSPSPTPTPPPPTNNAPQITSDGDISVQENVSGIIYQVFANDADGNRLTFSISGGADAALFSIDSTTGEVTLTNALNFENPSDADDNNVYEVRVSVTDGKATATQTQTITVGNEQDAAVLTRIAIGLGDVVAMSGIEFGPLYVARANGDLFEVQTNTLEPRPAGNLFSGISVNEPRVKAIAAEWDNTGQLVIHALLTQRTAAGRQAVLQTFTSPNIGVWVSRAVHRSESITAAQEPLVSGSIVKGTGGRVFFLSSDGGNPDRAQLDTMLGNLVRIMPVTAAPTTYNVVTLAKGLHNPVGASLFDGVGFVLDSGETRYDEINLFDRVATGQNFGWPFREGRNEVRAGGMGPFLDPVLEFDRQGSGHGLFRAMVYYESFLASIAGNFLLVTSDGRFFGVDPADIRNGDITSSVQPREIRGELKPTSGSLDNVKAMAAFSSSLFVLDGDGELYLAEFEVP
ncbi:MAG: cadherin domain-containing protein [Alteraurantiacibacter sp.]